MKDIVERQIAQRENMADNFQFVKSETDIFVQLSDVVAGILREYGNKNKNRRG